MALRQRLALHRWRDACAGQADRAGAVHHPGREAAIENGMAEAFVKTFERDYAWVRPRPDAATIIAQLADWFEQYNTVHPHKSLGCRSPREFRASVKNGATASQRVVHGRDRVKPESRAKHLA